MEENRKLAVLALVIMLGGNAGNIINNISPKDYRPDPFTGLDGERLRGDLLEIYNLHLMAQQKELEKIRQRLSRCEYQVKRCAVE